MKIKKIVYAIILSILIISSIGVVTIGSSSRFETEIVNADFNDKKFGWNVNTNKIYNFNDEKISEYRNKEFKEVDGITNILLLGTDKRGVKDGVRTDSMIIATIDTVHHKVKLTTLYRDVLVEIRGHGKGKLNWAYAFGGIDLLKETIEDNYLLKIDDYVLLDFNSFIKVIDTLGGVDVNIDKKILKEFNQHINDIQGNTANNIKSAGKHRLNGTQALSYARVRYNSGGEQGRTKRQREIISSISEKMKTISILKYPNIVQSILGNVETSLDIKQIINLAYTVHKMDYKDIDTLSVPFEPLCKEGKYKKYGWVFRTDLYVTAQLLNMYIYQDEPVDLSKVDKESLSYLE
ncbi:cell envelope-related function transcriptional attenuator common domain protein [Clostridioides difficile CD160]|nr:cell envelope-related function transcriptional attenuator common domain protein [Clostridioides difficile CD160]